MARQGNRKKITSKFRGIVGLHCQMLLKSLSFLRYFLLICYVRAIELLRLMTWKLN